MDIVEEIYGASYGLPSDPGLPWLERIIGTVPNNVCVRAGDEIARLRALLGDAGAYMSVCPPPSEAGDQLRAALQERRSRVLLHAADQQSLSEQKS